MNSIARDGPFGAAAQREQAQTWDQRQPSDRWSGWFWQRERGSQRAVLQAHTHAEAAGRARSGAAGGPPRGPPRGRRGTARFAYEEAAGDEAGRAQIGWVAEETSSAAGAVGDTHRAGGAGGQRAQAGCYSSNHASRYGHQAAGVSRRTGGGAAGGMAREQRQLGCGPFEFKCTPAVQVSHVPGSTRRWRHLARWIHRAISLAIDLAGGGQGERALAVGVRAGTGYRLRPLTAEEGGQLEPAVAVSEHLFYSSIRSIHPSSHVASTDASQIYNIHSLFYTLFTRSAYVRTSLDGGRESLHQVN